MKMEDTGWALLLFDGLQNNVMFFDHLCFFSLKINWSQNNRAPRLELCGKGSGG